MCGINGFTNKNAAVLSKMMDATAHRGPDARDTFFSDTVSLGHNRLSVIDLSSAANQPMTDPTGRFTIVFNGEIYNYRELRTELAASWNFKTEGDTEVLLAGYVQWGVAVLHRLKGIFAFGIWDGYTEELVLARDHMGVKPLYYGSKDAVLYFSSELSGLIAGTEYRTLSLEGVSHYISHNYVPSPLTLVDGIYKLQPGQLLRYKNAALQLETYWSPNTPKASVLNASELRDVIEKGVQRQLVSDRKLGMFLSGGLDSTIVLHHACKHLPQLDTFSVDFEMVKGAESEAAKFNSDASLAAETAAHYGASHTTFTISLGDVREVLDMALSSVDEPVANPTVVAQYVLAKWVRERGVVVALGGDGGDELFGGYTRHRIVLGAQYFQQLPSSLQRVVGYLFPQTKKLTLPLRAPMHMQLMSLKPKQYMSVVQGTDIEKVVRDFFDTRYDSYSSLGLSPIDLFMRIDRESWLADESLARTDRTSMSFGVEARVPLLDIDIVQYADAIEGTKKFTPWSNKKILRDAYTSHLPSNIFNQPKRGWISPGAKWLRDPVILKYATEVLSKEYYDGLCGIVDFDGIQQMLREHHTGGYHLYPLWNILQLQVWAKKYKIVVS